MTATTTVLARPQAELSRKAVRRLLVWLGIGIVTALAAMTAVTLAYLRHQAVESGEQLTQSIAQVVEEQTARTLQSVDLRLRLALHTYEALRSANALDAQSGSAVLREAHKELPFAVEVFILSADGVVAFDSGVGITGSDRSDRDYFRIYRETAQSALWIGPSLLNRAAATYAFVVARPIRSVNGDFAGVIVAALDPKYFDQVWRRVAVGDGGSVAMLRRDGALVVRSPPADAPAMNLDFRQSVLFREHLPRSENGTYIQASRVDGVERLYGYRTVRVYPDLLVLVGRSYDVVLQDWRRFAWFAVAIFAMAAAATGFLCVSLNRAWRQKYRAEAHEREISDRLALATDAAAIGVWDWNIATDEWHATPTYFTMLGYRPEAGREHHRRWLERVHPDDLPAVESLVKNVLAGKAAEYEFEARMRHFDGSYRWIDMLGHTLARDSAGRPSRMIGVKIDITRRKRDELALKESNEFGRAILDSVIAQIAVLDGNGTITAVNEPWRRFSADPAAITTFARPLAGVGENYLAACRQGHDAGSSEAEAVVRGIAAVLDGSVPAYFVEHTCQSQTGKRWFHMAVTPLRSGRPGAAISQNEITERKMAEHALLELNATLEHRVERRTSELTLALKELDSFAYAVAHDLRTPLRGIDGFANILQDRLGANLQTDSADALFRIRRAARRMGELIDDLLRLSQVSRSQIAFEKCDLASLARLIADDLVQSDPARHVTFAIAESLEVPADRQLVRVLLENLLRNAWKFTSKRPHARIEVGAEPHEGALAYYVRDNGAGFDMAHAAKLFEPFQRLHMASDFPGTGIGLATVSRITRRHGGRVWARGAVDGGATFYFTLSAEGSG